MTSSTSAIDLPSWFIKDNFDLIDLGVLTIINLCFAFSIVPVCLHSSTVILIEENSLFL